MMLPSMEKKGGHVQGLLSEMEGVKWWVREIVNCHIPTGFATDALVCLQAMSLGVDLGFREVILEGRGGDMVGTGELGGEMVNVAPKSSDRRC
ncbi:hypothetical protein Gohar_014872 [Gossypium harknessii]|uniref:Uncharacterized protein n=1 Tax=Gossypium harknessii TaxID=34285 RepID=A0A7J9FYJ3_9ROSI|nr:hypothetical protein [Gossypium harknessii]